MELTSASLYVYRYYDLHIIPDNFLTSWMTKAWVTALYQAKDVNWCSEMYTIWLIVKKILVLQAFNNSIGLECVDNKLQ